MLILGACDEAPTPPAPPVESVGCAASGTVAGDVTVPTVWTRAASPWHLTGEVVVDDALTIEAGVVVCGAEGATLRVRTGPLRVEGTEVDTVVFTASDAAAPWGGIVFPGIYDERDTSSVAWARIEHAEVGVEYGPYWIPLEARHLHVRHVRGAGLAVRAGRVTDARLDTVCGVCETGGVDSRWGGDVALDRVVVRGSGAAGLFLAGHTTLGRVTVVDSRGAGIATPEGANLAGDELRVVGPVTVTGGASYPFRGHLGHAVRLASGPEAVERLRGNARDTLVVLPSYDDLGSDTLVAGLPWRIGAGGAPGRREVTAREVVVEAGAELVVDGTLRGGDAISLLGTAEAPVRMTGSGLVVEGEFARDPRRSVFRHASLRGVDLRLAGDAALLEDVAMEGASLTLDGGNVEIRGLRLTATPLEVMATDALLTGLVVEGAGGDGVAVRRPGVTLRECVIRGSGGAGVRVTAGEGVEVHGCDLVGNAGPGVVAQGPSRVDARGNWWGVPGGPAAPRGDGAEGPVDVSGALPAPSSEVERGAPARVVVPTADLTVEVGIPTPVPGYVADAAGVALPGEPLLYRVADREVATSLPEAPGTLLGLREGSTTLLLLAVSDTSLRATIDVTVRRAGPAPVWGANPAGPRDEIRGVTGRGSGDLFAVGVTLPPAGAPPSAHATGLTLRWGGAAWNRGGGPGLVAVGARSDTVWAADRRSVTSSFETRLLRLSDDGRLWMPVAVRRGGGGGHDLWVGQDGVVFTGTLHREGPELVSPPGAQPSCHHDSGRVVTEVYAVCEVPFAQPSSRTFRWDGRAWTPLPSWSVPARPHAVFAGDHSVWVVGEAGTVQRWDGAAWHAEDARVSVDLLAVYGTGDDDVWAVGEGGTIIHFDGRRWRRVPVPTDADLHAVWTGDGTVLVGGLGVALRGTLDP